MKSKVMFQGMGMNGKNSYPSAVLILFLIVAASSCKDDSGEKNNPLPSDNGAAPSITKVEFVTQTDCKVHFGTAPGEYTVEVLPDGNYYEGGASPLAVDGLPKGMIYEFRIARGSESAGTDVSYSESSGKVLASVNENQQLDRVKMLELINEARKVSRVCGTENMPAVQPLNWDDRLENAAIVHTKDMDQYKYMAHTSISNGSTPSDRIADQNYSYKWWAENVAVGSLTEEAVMTLWINSPPHCKNIMSANVTEIGSARVGSYWTQVFGRE